MRAGIHPLHVSQELRKIAEQFSLVTPIKRVGYYEISDRHAIRGNELTSLHVLFEHGRHFLEVTAGKSHVFGQSLLFGIERRMAGSAREGGVQLRRGQQEA